MTGREGRELKEEILREFMAKLEEKLNPLTEALKIMPKEGELKRDPSIAKHLNSLLALGVALKNIDSPEYTNKNRMDELGRDFFGVYKVKEKEIERDGFGRCIKKKEESEEFERDGFGRRINRKFAGIAV